MDRLGQLFRSRLLIAVLAGVAGALVALWVSGAGDWRDVALVLATGALTLVVGEISAGREAERQRTFREEQRRHERAKELGESRRRFHQEYIDASRKTYLDICDTAALMASGRGAEAFERARGMTLSESLRKADATLLTIDGSPGVLLAFSSMMTEAAQHAGEPPDLGRRTRVNDVASSIATAFFAQEYRLANGEEPLRVTDRAALAELQRGVATTRDALARLARERAQREPPSDR